MGNAVTARTREVWAAEPEATPARMRSVAEREVWTAPPGTPLPAGAKAAPPAGFQLAGLVYGAIVHVDPAGVGSVRVEWMSDSAAARFADAVRERFVALLAREREGRAEPWINRFGLYRVRFHDHEQLPDVGARSFGFAHGDGDGIGRRYIQEMGHR